MFIFGVSRFELTIILVVYKIKTQGLSTTIYTSVLVTHTHIIYLDDYRIMSSMYMDLV